MFKDQICRMLNYHHHPPKYVNECIFAISLLFPRVFSSRIHDVSDCPLPLVHVKSYFLLLFIESYEEYEVRRHCAGFNV